jgi:hypothetical protein
MAQRNRPHILVNREPARDAYTPYQSGRGSKRPPSPTDRRVHGQGLAAAAREAAAVSLDRRTEAANALGVSPSTGTYVVFDGVPGFQLELPAFDPQTGWNQPCLVAVAEISTPDGVVERATVFVPEGRMQYFVERFGKYATDDTEAGNPKHANFVERITAVRLATVEALWTDAEAAFPDRQVSMWWEVWLRRHDGAELERLASVAERLGMQIGERHLVFDNRIIVLVHATVDMWSAAIDIFDDLAELRRARITAEFFAAMPPVEQVDWVNDLVTRLETAPSNAPRVCVLDTGVNAGHPLLAASLAGEDVHTCEPAWGSHDHHGHGTAMAGLALYGNLTEALDTAGRVRLRHHLESVKVLPPNPITTAPELLGTVTADAVSRAEIQAPSARRSFSMSVTADAGTVPGMPTSWSAAMDALACGRMFDADAEELLLDENSNDHHRLFVVSAGNVRTFDGTENHLDRSDLEAVEDPAQAWNVLTVGAFTELVDVHSSGPDFDGWEPVAGSGELSPFSRTSVPFHRQWPIKPEVVMEGGNTARSPGNDIDWPGSLQVLTTHYQPGQRLLTTTNATSAATAQVGHLTGAISAEYPSLWPETVRALIVHSAEWTPSMIRWFPAPGKSKGVAESLVRRYGFGVPSLTRSIRSGGDALTLLVQATIKPFEHGRLREMHTHDLPWPAEELERLADAPVRLRVTLSHFVEPNPTRRGWRRRFRYASHDLRFELKQPAESNDDFLKRLNKRALDEEENRPAADDNDGWTLGSHARNRGSLHADFWHGTAADLAARGRLAVYPVSGWWKDQQSRDRSEQGVRYGIVVSIETPVETADLWTPVALEVGLPVEVWT